MCAGRLSIRCAARRRLVVDGGRITQQGRVLEPTAGRTPTPLLPLVSRTAVHLGRQQVEIQQPVRFVCTLLRYKLTDTHSQPHMSTAVIKFVNIHHNSPNYEGIVVHT